VPYWIGIELDKKKSPTLFKTKVMLNQMNHWNTGRNILLSLTIIKFLFVSWFSWIFIH